MTSDPSVLHPLTRRATGRDGCAKLGRQEEQVPGIRDRIDGLRSRRWGRRTVFVASGVLALVVVLVVVGVVAGPSIARKVGLGGGSSAEAASAPPRLRLSPLAGDAPTPTAAGVTDRVAKLTEDDALGTLTGVVLDPTRGTVLWSRSPDKAMPPGSTNKLLTMAAALLTLPPTGRFRTRVVAGPTPDSVVLVGGGDPTLTSLPAPQPSDPPGTGESVYPGAARLDDLAQEVRAAHPAPVRTVTVDLNRYTGPSQAPGWESGDIAGGQFTPLVPLILDGGRSKPAELDPPRSANPAADAGTALAQRLGADPAGVAATTAPPNAPVLAEVVSPSVADLVETALRISDNVLAEALARQVALARGADPSFAGSAAAVRDALREAGFDVTGVNTVDGSGLSTEDEVPARLLGQIITAASGPDSDPRAVKLRPLLSGLPVAGGDGTLGDRYGSGDSAAGRGWVRAKTGTLSGVSALAGTVADSDGRLLAFALMSNGTSPAESRPALDAIAAALRGCGCR